MDLDSGTEQKNLFDVKNVDETAFNGMNKFIFSNYAEKPDDNLFNRMEPDEPKDTFPELKRLNDFDSNMMEQTSVKSLDNNFLKLEMEIKNIKNKIKDIEEQIELLKLVNWDSNKKHIESLVKQKNLLEEILPNKKEKYKKQKYKKLNLISNFTDKLTAVPSKIFKIFTHPYRSPSFSINEFSYLELFKRIFPKWHKNKQIKCEVKKLLLIEKKLNELVSNKAIPFGEQESIFNNFTSFFGKAYQVDAGIKNLTDTKQKIQKINIQPENSTPPKNSTPDIEKIMDNPFESR